MVSKNDSRGLLAVAATAAAGFVGAVSMAHDWTTASRASAGLAPDPAPTREAVVQDLHRARVGLAGTVRRPQLDRRQADRRAGSVSA